MPKLAYVCETCGVTFYRERALAQQHRRKFCSVSCSIIGRRRPLEERFWEKVKKTDNCWLWIGARSGGYGMIRRGDKAVIAHRLAYEWTNGPIPDGLDICHTCDNPACVRPSHLFAGTARDNALDAAHKGRLVVPRGERSSFAKLKDADIPNIRRLLAEGITKTDIGKQYGVSRTTIYGIASGHNWTHIK